MKEKLEDLEDWFHLQVHLLMEDFIMPFLFLCHVSLRMQEMFNNGGIIGFILAIAIICYAKSYKQKVYSTEDKDEQKQKILDYIKKIEEDNKKE